MYSDSLLPPHTIQLETLTKIGPDLSTLDEFGEMRSCLHLLMVVQCVPEARIPSRVCVWPRLKGRLFL